MLTPTTHTGRNITVSTADCHHMQWQDVHGLLCTVTSSCRTPQAQRNIQTFNRFLEAIKRLNAQRDAERAAGTVEEKLGSIRKWKTLSMSDKWTFTREKQGHMTGRLKVSYHSTVSIKRKTAQTEIPKTNLLNGNTTVFKKTFKFCARLKCCPPQKKKKTAGCYYWQNDDEDDMKW